MSTLGKIYYSFPVQLLLLHLKKHQVLILFWVVLFGIIIKAFARKFGVPFLFLDPEYLGKVSFMSFMFMGAAFAAFVMSWNITTYILHSFRFPFLATIEKPFSRFCLNNSIIPLVILLVYVYFIISFQSKTEFRIGSRILFQLLGFTAGLLAMVSATLIYFSSTNKNLFKFFGIRKWKVPPRKIRASLWTGTNWEHKSEPGKTIPVRYYLINPVKAGKVGETWHYDKAMISTVLQHHHLNALVIELIALATVVVLGLLIGYPAFRIPAGASILLLFTIMVMFIGAFSFWLRGWRTSAFLAVFIILNYLIRYELFESKNKAYGISYDEPMVEYSLPHLKELSSDDIVRADIQSMKEVLENWHAKSSRISGSTRPRFVIINTTGGGLRSAAWTFHVMQTVDSMLGGRFLEHTFLITGASAGLIGASWYRELYRESMKKPVNLHSREHYSKICRDVLNPVVYSLFVNDIFFPIRKYRVNGNQYNKDRGFEFERQLNENTDYLMNRKISDYYDDEFAQRIPLLIAAPTITNDGRKLYISSLPVSFLTRPLSPYPVFSMPEIDGVEFQRLLKEKNASDLLFTSALRMNATFPYITPNVALPTDPPLEVMDAGMRDNFGLETTVRFIRVFSDWIKENTGGVVIIQIRDSGKTTYINPNTGQTFFDRLLNPVGNFYSHWDEYQDYSNDNLVEHASSWLNGKLELIRFEYIPSSTLEAASLSWRLTTDEKENILNTIRSEHNQAALLQLTSILGE